MKTVICKESIEAAKIVVLGSYNADLMMKIPRFAKPGETLIAGPFLMGSGGKGSNQAVAAAKLGADVSAIIKVGTDVFSNTAIELYEKIGMNTKYVARDASVTTGVAIVLVEEVTAENACIIEQGANVTITKEDVDAADEAFANADIFLTQLENNVEMNEYAIDKAKSYGKRVILNPAPAKAISDNMLSKADYVTPNEIETEFFTGVKIENREDMDKAAEILKSKGVKNVLITLGSKGVYVNSEEAGLVDIIPSCTVENPQDTTGAGDSFNGAMATCLAAGYDLRTAIEFACAVAAVAISKNGASASMPDFEEAYGMYQKQG